MAGWWCKHTPGTHPPPPLHPPSSRRHGTDCTAWHTPPRCSQHGRGTRTQTARSRQAPRGKTPPTAPISQPAGFRVQGSGFWVQGSGCRVQGAGFRVQGAGFRVQSAGGRVQGSGCRVQGSGAGLRHGASPRCCRTLFVMGARQPAGERISDRNTFINLVQENSLHRTIFISNNQVSVYFFLLKPSS